MAKKIFFIPQKNYDIIAVYENNIIKETGKIDVPDLLKSVFLENRLIVSLCPSQNHGCMGLKIFNEYGNILLSKDLNQVFESINYKGNVVYLGGRYINEGNELFSYIDLTDIDLTDIDLKMNEVNIPIRSVIGKTIDDILIRNNTLFLIDNVYSPKYVFEYNISTPNNPIYIRTVNLELHGTIDKGEINDNWSILLSSFGSHGVGYQIISIFEKEGEWDERLHFSYSCPFFENKESIVDRLLDFLIFLLEKCSFKKTQYDIIMSEQKKLFDQQRKLLAQERKFLAQKKSILARQPTGPNINISVPILDIGIINDNLLILSENGLYSIDLTKKITDESITKICGNKNKYERLLKINNEHYIVLNAEKYELIL